MPEKATGDGSLNASTRDGAMEGTAVDQLSTFTFRPKAKFISSIEFFATQFVARWIFEVSVRRLHCYPTSV